MAHEDILSRTDFFADADPDVADVTLAAASEERSLVRGDVLFNEGDEPDALYVVLRGRIAIANQSFDKRESVVALMEPGDLFGEMGMLDDRPRSAMARALEPSTVLADPVRRRCSASAQRIPTCCGAWPSCSPDGSGRWTRRSSDSVFLDVTGRTAKRLLELADGADEFMLPVTQEELAGMVGASRERVNKAIATFIRLGWIEQHDRRYRILLRDRLELRAR